MLSLARNARVFIPKTKQLFGNPIKCNNALQQIFYGNIQKSSNFKIPPSVRQTGTISLRLKSDSSSRGKKPVGYWLMTCGGMVFGAVILGITGYYLLLKSTYTVAEEIVEKTRKS